jgi:predicted acetyltransferase
MPKNINQRLHTYKTQEHLMENLKLVTPSPAYLGSYLEACRESKEAGVTTYTLHDPDAFDTWKETIFREYAREARGQWLRPGIVPSTTFWTVEGDAFVGIGNIRHRLNANLKRFGGHIGYAIRPSRWGSGYGTAQLALLLREARALGIDPALVTCNIENRGSARVIEKNGGVFVDTVPNRVDGRDILTCRFWVPTGGGGLSAPAPDLSAE